MNPKSNIRVKIYIDNLSQVRRFQIASQTSFDAFKQQVLQLVHLRDTEDIEHAFRMQYVDTDQDWVELQTNEEWEQAKEDILSSADSKSSTVLVVRARLFQRETELCRQKRQKQIQDRNRAREEYYKKLQAQRQREHEEWKNRMAEAAAQERKRRQQQLHNSNSLLDSLLGFDLDSLLGIQVEPAVTLFTVASPRLQAVSRPQSAAPLRPAQTQTRPPTPVSTAAQEVATVTEASKPQRRSIPIDVIEHSFDNSTAVPQQQEISTGSSAQVEDKKKQEVHAQEDDVIVEDVAPGESPETQVPDRMELLHDLGFTNDALNQNLLDHYQGNLHKVILALRSGTANAPTEVTANNTVTTAAQ